MPRTQTYEGVWSGESVVGSSGPGQGATSLVLTNGGTLMGVEVVGGQAGSCGMIYLSAQRRFETAADG